MNNTTKDVRIKAIRYMKRKMVVLFYLTEKKWVVYELWPVCGRDLFFFFFFYWNHIKEDVREADEFFWCLN